MVPVGLSRSRFGAPPRAVLEPPRTPEQAGQQVGEVGSACISTARGSRAAQLHPDKVTELLESYRSGTPSLTLAAEFGINESTVYAHIERSGVDRRPYRKLHGADLERARRLYESGTSLRAVAAEVGCSVSAVHSRLVELVVRMRPRR